MSLYTSSMNSSESNNYRLRMYVDENYNPQGDGGNLTFAVQVNVYGKAGLSMEDRMMKERVSGEDFHTDEYKSSITSIVTKGDTIIPESATESWDISEKQNGSVIAYVEDDGTGSGTYKLTIGSQDKIIANYNMSNYFDGFINTKTIDLTHLDTSMVTDMSWMFSRDIFSDLNMTLKEIIFGNNFDTSNVEDMGGMFAFCSSIEELDLSNFDTSKVTSMARMFFGCTSLTKLNLSSFDTSNVSSMMQMFQGCSSLTSLDLRSFDTFKVSTNSRNYSTMFNELPNITQILVTRDKWTIPPSADIFNGSGVTGFTYL